ncbi:hypothetical protein YC2023_120119 [Brassica napus]
MFGFETQSKRIYIYMCVCVNRRRRIMGHKGVGVSEKDVKRILMHIIPCLNESLLQRRAIFSGDPPPLSRLRDCENNVHMEVVIFILARCGFFPLSRRAQYIHLRNVLEGRVWLADYGTTWLKENAAKCFQEDFQGYRTWKHPSEKWRMNLGGGDCRLICHKARNGFEDLSNRFLRRHRYD